MLVAIAVVAAGVGAGVTALANGGSRTRTGRVSPSVAVHPAHQSVTVTAPRQRASSGAQQRRALEQELEASVAHDARVLVGRRYLRGPVIGSTCTLMGSVESTPAGIVGHYNCMAIARQIPSPYTGAPPTLEGARFFGTINFTANTYTFRGD